MTSRILSRYIALQFLRPFVYGVALFSIVILLGDVFDHLNAFMRSQAGFGVILTYLGYQVPYWTVRILPASTLLAALFCMGSLMGSGEWIATQATGFSPGQVLRPVLWCALAVSVGAFVLQETILPRCYRNADRLYREEIKGEPAERRWKFDDVDITAAPDEHLHAKELNVRTGWITGAVWTVVGPSGAPRRQRTAARGHWDQTRGLWVFYDGVEREFREDLRTVETPFESWESPLRTDPEHLEFGRYDADSKSLLQTLDFIRRRRELGLSTHQPETAAHMKFAYPIANLIITALAIPLALSLGGGGRVVSSVLALIVGFFYWWLISLSEAFGFAGRFPPAISAWIPNAVFAAIAGALGWKKLR